MHQTIQSNTVALAPQNANHDFVARTVNLFNFEGFDVRVVLVDGEPWFSARDVAEGLGYSNPQKAVRDHCKSPRPVGVNDSFTLGPSANIIPERDVYRLVMRSKMPQAERFEEWVVSEVLPSIRKTGGYTAPAQPADLSKLEILQMALESEKARVLLTVQVEAQAKKIDHLENLFKEGMSHVQFCKGLNGVNVMQVGHFLERRNWLYNESKSGTRYRVAAYARDKYMTEHQQEITPHGKEAFISYTPILLRKGAVRLYELYLAGELPMKKNWDGLHTHDKAVRGAA
ncbi:transporter [Pseudomonas sp. SbB1]|uniref:Prophage antirepressor n=1 Tax=Pseudomonas putida (strain GB-1) TaxID=76869 RepID=B0KKM7_PSEPG|nr:MULTISPECIES: BRO family protein [Pseudomonas]ABY99331.1 prophage antirepressor [Pseudomonas putida GB-1]MBP0706945.1 transporter [Pseudomonas sp. T34]MCE0778900.1 transporter [Pseudomonas sp. NMI542_15]MCK2186383.1 transporter [Pseudomonas sp. MB04B]MDD2083510.1 BRO family protein [Pseudomonas putida]